VTLTDLRSWSDVGEFERVLWESPLVMAAYIEKGGYLTAASVGLEQAMLRPLVGTVAVDLVARPQRDAFASTIRHATADWSPHLFGLAIVPNGIAVDVEVTVRRQEQNVLLMMRPMGDAPFVDLLDDLVASQRELTRRNAELEQTLAELEATRVAVSALNEAVAMCAWCRHLREGTPGDPVEPRWLPIEQYLAREGRLVSHALCDDCAQQNKQRLSG